MNQVHTVQIIRKYEFTVLSVVSGGVDGADNICSNLNMGLENLIGCRRHLSGQFTKHPLTTFGAKRIHINLIKETELASFYTLNPEFFKIVITFNVG